MCELEINNKGWNYTMEGIYKLNDDLSSSLDYVIFNVKFDNKLISTRLLDEYLSVEEELKMLNDIKEKFIKSILYKPGTK